eukprot:4370607-Prymnesium_polylepis.1
MEHAQTIGALCGGRLAKATGVRSPPPGGTPIAILEIPSLPSDGCSGRHQTDNRSIDYCVELDM